MQPDNDDVIESALFSTGGTDVKLIKSKDDPLCIRVSAGGEQGEGYYLNYRGDLKEVQKMLNRLIEVVNIKLDKTQKDLNIN